MTTIILIFLTYILLAVAISLSILLIYTKCEINIIKTFIIQDEYIEQLNKKMNTVNNNVSTCQSNYNLLNRNVTLCQSNINVLSSKIQNMPINKKPTIKLNVK